MHDCLIPRQKSHSPKKILTHAHPNLNLHTHFGVESIAEIATKKKVVPHQTKRSTIKVVNVKSCTFREDFDIKDKEKALSANSSFCDANK